MFVYFKTTQHRGFDEILNDEDDEKTLIEMFLQKRIENGPALQKSMSPDHRPSRPPKSPHRPSPDSSSYSLFTNSTVIVLDDIDDEDISENENSLNFVECLDFSGYQIGNQRGLRRKQMQKLWKLFLN